MSSNTGGICAIVSMVFNKNNNNKNPKNNNKNHPQQPPQNNKNNKTSKHENKEPFSVKYHSQQRQWWCSSCSYASIHFCFIHLLKYSSGVKSPIHNVLISKAELKPTPPRNSSNCCKEALFIPPVETVTLCTREIINWSMNAQETLLRAHLTFPFLFSASSVFLLVINVKKKKKVNKPGRRVWYPKCSTVPLSSPCLVESFNQMDMVKLFCFLASPKY